MTPALLLNGGRLDNKGDHLMLAAVTHRVRSWGVAPVWDTLYATYEERSAMGLYQRLLPKGRGLFAGTLGRAFLNRYGRPYGIVADEKCGGVLDFRGYAFGDCWDINFAQDAERTFRRWHKQGIKIFILPQAFGPLRDETWMAITRKAMSFTDLICPRDDKSLQALVDCGVPIGRLHKVPDLTFGFWQIQQPPSELDGEDYIVFVPNKWMLERTPAKVRRAYLPWMIKMSHECSRLGYVPLLLPMSRTLDMNLVDKLMGDPTSSFRLISLDNPLRIKEVIGSSKACVTSRYHALVSALSFGIPSVATSWSHKYDELMKDFKLGQGLIAEEDIVEERVSSLAVLLDWANDHSLTSRLKEQSSKACVEVESMWEQVKSVLGMLEAI